MSITRVLSASFPLHESHPHPASTYETAIAKYQAMLALDGRDINEVCHTTLLTHGQRVQRVAVLLHGLTNCPRQFAEFAPLLFARGYNVLMPRMPRNGLADRDTEDLKHLTPQELRTWCDAVCDIAVGVGDEVIVMGLSGGGTLAAWMAQCRPEVSHAYIVAPLLGIVPNEWILGRRTSQLVTFVLSVIPNIMTQKIARRFKDGPPYGYYGFATHGLVAYMTLGNSVYSQATRTPQAAQRITMILNDADPAVNTRYNLDLLHAWEAHAPAAGKAADAYHFPAEKRLIHDIIDPNQVEQQTAYVYPILLSLITGAP